MPKYDPTIDVELLYKKSLFQNQTTSIMPNNCLYGLYFEFPVSPDRNMCCILFLALVNYQ